MGSVYRLSLVGIVAMGFMVTMNQSAEAQYPIAVSAAVPVAPVAYVPERRGLFGRRVVYRPVVAPVAYAAPVAVARPVVTVARPVVAAPVVTVARPVVAAPYVTVARPVVTVARPVVAAPVVVARPVVHSYYAPAPVVPVTTYRYPTYYPVVGF